MVHKIGIKQVCTIHEKIPTRLNVAILLFMACFISYMLRVNMSINILGMVEPTNLHENKSLASAPDYGPRYNWTTSEQSLLLGSYFWGYLFTTLPGGLLAEWIGGRSVVGWTMAASAILTAVIPLCAGLSYWLVFILRFATGVAGGVLYPALHSIIAKWAPPNEKGKFVSALLGGTFGTVITWPVAGILMETLGWVYAFYIPALVTFALTIVWFYVISDTPAEHPRIRTEEKEYIQKAIGDTVSNKKEFPPYAKLLISMPFLSLLALHYGNMWGLYFLITAAPKFMSEVLGFSLAKAGFLASLPYLARMFSGFIFGTIGDYVRQKDYMSVTATRKFFCVFSHIIPGLFLMILAYMDDNPYVCVAIITLSLGFNGASTVTNLQNAQDLAPNFAGTIYGTINFIGATSGFITPLIVAHFTQDRNTIDEWSILFIIGAVAYILPALIFIMFGSGEVQPWNEPTIKKVDETLSAPATNGGISTITTSPTSIPNSV